MLTEAGASISRRLHYGGISPFCHSSVPMHPPRAPKVLCSLSSFFVPSKEDQNIQKLDVAGMAPGNIIVRSCSEGILPRGKVPHATATPLTTLNVNDGA